MMMHTIGVPMRLKLAIRVLSLLFISQPKHKLSIKITILFFIINIFNLTEITKRVSASYCSF
jgi:hypothetical protein